MRQQLLAFFMREWNFVRRHYMWRLVWIVYDLMWAVSIGFLASAAGDVTGLGLTRQQYIMYLMLGSFMWTYLSSVFANITWSIVRERWEGTIEYTFMAPVDRAVHLLGISVFAILWGILRMIIVFGVCAVIFGLDFSSANLIGATIIIAVATVSFVGLGMLISVFPLIDHENGDKVPSFAEAIIMMVSGIYYPVAIMPVWLQWVSTLSPAKYALEGIRAAVLGGASVAVLWGAIWPLALCGLALIPLGLWGFSVAEKYAKRTGKLKRDG